jgi:outer membrane protein OmpA-like peptidoglycan-associated protein
MKNGLALLTLAAIALGAPLPVGAQPGTAEGSERLPIYFAANASELTPEAKAVIEEAAKTIKRTAAKTIIVVGAAGLTGSERAGPRLRAERASAIESELIAQGVAVGQIATLVDADLTAATGEAPSPFASRSAGIIIEPQSDVGL